MNNPIQNNGRDIHVKHAQLTEQLKLKSKHDNSHHFHSMPDANLRI